MERALFVDTHQPAIPGDIARKNCSQLPIHAIDDHDFRSIGKKAIYALSHGKATAGLRLAQTMKPLARIACDLRVSATSSLWHRLRRSIQKSGVPCQSRPRGRQACRPSVCQWRSLKLGRFHSRESLDLTVPATLLAIEGNAR